MPMSPDDWAWFAASVLGAAAEIRAEDRMSVEVKGLADTVLQARAAIAQASTAAMRMNDSALRVAQVEDMIKQLNVAEADLAAAVGQLSNGGPPWTRPRARRPP